MPFSIFRLRTLRGGNLVSLLLGMALFSMFFFISLYLQDVLHYSAIKTGVGRGVRVRVRVGDDRRGHRDQAA
jgi:hypothetical protein